MANSLMPPQAPSNPFSARQRGVPKDLAFFEEKAFDGSPGSGYTQTQSGLARTPRQRSPCHARPPGWSGVAPVGSPRNLSENFPFGTGLLPNTMRGGNDVFVAKLDPASDLVWFSIAGGTGYDLATAIKLGSDSGPYIAGHSAPTGDPSTDFPTTSGAYQTMNHAVPSQYGTTSNGFVAKLNIWGTDFVYSTFLGGSGDDLILDLGVDGVGNAYVTGSTDSTDFPAPNFKGATDAFVAKFDPTGAHLLYSEFLAGTGQNSGQGIAVDTAGDAYVTGSTDSISDFPLGSHPFQANPCLT